MPDNPEPDRSNCERRGSAPRQQLPSGLAPGLLVTARDAAWRVLSWTSHDDCREVSLLGESGQRVLLWPFDPLQPIDEIRHTHIVSKRRWARHVAALVRDRRRPAGLLARPAAASILPYQLDPVLAMAGGAMRLLLADEVGLGKTVQAGWIAADLLAREPGARILVCTPAGLKSQWHQELARLFGIDAAVVDSRWLRRRVGDLPADVNPWCLPGLYLASLDFIKRADVVPLVTSEPWDLLIVDEVHGAAAPTERHAAISSIARTSRRVVLITATPFSGDVAAFESLRTLGTAGDGEIRMFRRSRDDIGERRRRTHRFALVTPDGSERQLQRALERYTVEVWRRSGDAGAPRLAMTILRKRALSSPAALERSLRRRIALLECREPLPRQLTLFEEDGEPEDDEPSAALGAPGLDDVEREKRWLASLALLARAAGGVDTKRRFLSRLLTRIRDTSAIVFTEYRDTLRDIARDYPRAVQLHGGLSRQERDDVQQRFNEEGGLLLATDAAAEGLNLQGRCRLVINYELPWNPARLEQRIGRIDRIGQPRRVHAISLVSRDTAEDLVVANLLRRLDRVARTLGARDRLAGFIHDARVAQAVIGGVALGTETGAPLELQSISSVSDAAHAAAAQLRSILDLAPGSVHAHAEVAVCRLRHSRILPPGALFVVYWRARTRSGDVAANDIIPVHVDPRRDPRDRGVLRDVAAVAWRRATRLLETAVTEQRRLCDALIDRELEIAGSSSLPAWQPGLFDRRACHASIAAADRLREIDELHRRRIATLHDATGLESDLRLVAVLFVCHGLR